MPYLTVLLLLSLMASPSSETFLDLERRFAAAVLDRDGATVDSLLAEDLIHIGFEGQIARKVEYMSFFNDGDWRYSRYATSDLSVKVFPDSAIVTGLADRSIRVGTKETTGAFAFTHVWARAGDRWRITSSHVTTVGRP
ncbi:MAG TPA: nuclear transport factor 2 family protein [Thermoanaerobaculia bacterium]|nr:nuclear transport factor 2 family protein [Thermoanaerobaculia bacterium]